MSNRFREDIAKGEVEQEVQPEPLPEKAELPRNFFTNLLNGEMISKESATDALPFIVFLALLVMMYIANSHLAISNIREIDKLNKEVKELSWDFKTLKADLMQKSTQTEVAKYADTLGLKEPIEPPKKIIVSNEY